MSGMQNYRTPKPVFNFLNRRFGPFALDAFADCENALCKNYLTTKENAFHCEWVDKTFGNPPFSMTTLAVAKARFECFTMGRRSVLLIPVGGNQEWFRKLIEDPFVSFWYPDKRINFLTPEGLETSRSTHDVFVCAFGYEYADKISVLAMRGLI
jgi:phage N-6-adenine-methyltransferase